MEDYDCQICGCDDPSKFTEDPEVCDACLAETSGNEGLGPGPSDFDFELED